MRILHIFSDGTFATALQIIEMQSADYRVDIVDLSTEDIRYDDLIEKIFSYDKVISWK